MDDLAAYKKFLCESVSVGKFRGGDNMWSAIRDYNGGKLATTSDESGEEIAAFAKKVSKTTKEEKPFESGNTEITEDADIPNSDAEDSYNGEDEAPKTDDYIGDSPAVEPEESDEVKAMADYGQGDTDEDCPSCGEKIEEIYKQLGVSPIDLLEDEELIDDVELTEHENNVLERLIREMDETDAEKSSDEDEFLDDVEKAEDDVEDDSDDDEADEEDKEDDSDDEDDSELPD